MGNDFEPVVFAEYPELGRLKSRLIQEGAAAAGMSGSGSALFGLFRDKEAAAKAVARLSGEGAAMGFSVYGPMTFGSYAPPGRL